MKNLQFYYKWLGFIAAFVPRKKRRKLRKLRQLVKFYMVGNNLILVKTDGSKVINPLINQDFMNFGNIDAICGGATINIYEPIRLALKITISVIGGCKNANLEIKPGVIGFINLVVGGQNSYLHIGDNSIINGLCVSLIDGSVNIGSNCMFSDNISLWCGDSHSILDADTGKLTNAGGKCVIGNNVWCCQNVGILKGTYVPDGCIIGWGSVVNKKFDKPMSVLAGNPARIVKSGVKWCIQRPSEYQTGKFYLDR